MIWNYEAVIKSFSFFVSLQCSSFSGMYRFFHLAIPHNRFGSSMQTFFFLLSAVTDATGWLILE